MFQFTTTTVINDSIWDGEKDARWSFQEADDEKGTPATLNIKGVGIFKAPNITDAFKAVGHEGTIGSFKFKIPTLQNGDKLRLEFTIALSQIDNDSLYANDYSYKGKKFYIDFKYTNSATETAQLVEKMVKESQLNVYGRKLWNLIGNAGDIEVTGTTWSQRFHDVKLLKIERNVDYGREDEVDLNVEVEYVDAVDDFLTSDWMTRNLRLPTYARIRYTAFNKHENPIEGALYDQYTIHYCAKRGQLGLNAVGQEVKSSTTHVLFVKQDLSAKFEEELNKVLADADLELIEVEPKNP